MSHSERCRKFSIKSWVLSPRNDALCLIISLCSSSLKEDLSALCYELCINNFFIQLFFKRLVSFKLWVVHQSKTAPSVFKLCYSKWPQALYHYSHINSWHNPTIQEVTMYRYLMHYVKTICHQIQHLLCQKTFYMACEFCTEINLYHNSRGPEQQAVTYKIAAFWGCTSGGVYVPCIYTHAGWELPRQLRSLLLCLCSIFRVLFNFLVC